MEIRNNYNIQTSRPAFGMAFKSPSADQMEEFTKLVTHNGRIRPRLAGKALFRLVERHANDKHFDFYWSNSGVVFEPKTSEAEHLMPYMRAEFVDPPESSIEKMHNKTIVNNVLNGNKYEAASTLKKVLMSLKEIAGVIKTRLAIEMYPEQEVLPREIRKASLNVQLLERKAQNQSVEKAKRTIIFTKKAEKDEIKRQKAVKIVSSVFEPAETKVKKTINFDSEMEKS